MDFYQAWTGKSEIENFRNLTNILVFVLNENENNIESLLKHKLEVIWKVNDEKFTFLLFLNSKLSKK